MSDKREQLVQRCLELYEDVDFGACKSWKDAVPGRKAVGFMPTYVPRELVHAAGMLPVGILGGGDGLEVIHGDAYYQSYICRIPRSTIELGVTGRLDFLDGLLFPSTCDVIRNLSGMWKIMFEGKYVRYFDVPQNYLDTVGGNYYVEELRELLSGLSQLAGRSVSDEDLRASIALYNENRSVVEEVYRLRAAEPWRAPAHEVYLLMRAGMVLPVEEHTSLLRSWLELVAAAESRPLDNARVVLTGGFCEQPPLNLIKSIELAGCYVVDDDFMLVNRWIQGAVPLDGDPLEQLASAYLHRSVSTAMRYEPTQVEKGRFLIESVRRTGAEGVVFAAPSFCDPALLERPMLHGALNKAGIPFTSFKYAENSGQMQPIREQAGTFADSIKLWSAA